MKAFIFGNNRVCAELVDFLRSKNGIEIAGVCLHQQKRQKYAEAIRDSLDPKTRVFEWDPADSSNLLDFLHRHECDIGLSFYFGYILPKDIIDSFSKGIINVHPAYLPFNRGSASNVFSFLDDTPAGVTIHYIDEGVDTGEIVAKELVHKQSIDTGETLYVKLEEKAIEMFKLLYPKVLDDSIPTLPRSSEVGTYHAHRELEVIDLIELDRLYSARDLINLLRARTFPPHESAYFYDEEGKKVYVRVCLSYE